MVPISLNHTCWDYDIFFSSSVCIVFPIACSIAYIIFWQHFYLNVTQIYFCRVGRQLVNIPSFMVRVDSEKHIDFSLTSPLGGGEPGRVKRKNSKKASGGGGDDEEEE